MSRYCAKPTCSQLVVTWFELSRESQRVIRRDTAAKHAIGLCELHAERFKVPAGWTYVSGDQTDSNDGPVKAWFLPVETESAQTAKTAADSPAGVDDTGSSSQLDNTEEGSMLDRAFHGPRTRNDAEHAEEETLHYQTEEIPFPPMAVR